MHRQARQRQVDHQLVCRSPQGSMSENKQNNLKTLSAGSKIMGKDKGLGKCLRWGCVSKFLLIFYVQMFYRSTLPLFPKMGKKQKFQWEGGYNLSPLNRKPIRLKIHDS